MQPGETVNFEFSSADASTAAAITLYDAAGTTRTLASNERLLIDSGQAYLAGSITGDFITDADADGAVDAKERIAKLGVGATNFMFGEEGYACAKGVTPKVKTSGAGQTDLTGTGRIVKTGSNGQRASWKQSNVPGA